MSDKSNLPTVLSRITEYLDSGGLWNPELAYHAAVRDLIRDARAEINRLQAAARDSDDHYADARAEIDRLRRICAALLSGFERRGLLPEGRPATDEEAQEAVALLFEREERLTRIIAALRRPSESVVTAVCIAEDWQDFDAVANIISAAVAAAEQEVGHA